MSHDKPPPPPPPPPAEEDDPRESGGLVRTNTTGWLDDSAAPPRMRDRSHSLEARVPAPGTDPRMLQQQMTPTQPGSPAPSQQRGGGIPPLREDMKVEQFESPPQRSKTSQGLEAGGSGAMGSSPTMGLRLDVDASPEVRQGMGVPGPSPFAPGENDELSKLGSSARGAGGFDLFSSTGTAAFSVKDKGASGAGKVGGESEGTGRGNRVEDPEGDEALFDTILKGSSRKGLPFGATTPLPPGATGEVLPGKKKKPPVARFENTFVPEEFPGRRVGDRDDEDIGSSEDEENVPGWRRWLPGFLGGVKKSEEAVPEPPFRAQSPGATSPGPHKERRNPGKQTKGVLSWVPHEARGPVSSWNLGTSTYFSAVPLALLRLLLLYVAIGCFVAIIITAVNDSGSPWKALLTSSLPYVCVMQVIFLLAASVASWMHLLQPAREIRGRIVWKAAAVIFNCVLLLSITQLARFFLLSAVQGLRPSNLSGADAVFSFESVYSITVYFVLLVSAFELAINNVPLRGTYLLAPFIFSIILGASQIGVAVGAATISVAAGMAVLSGVLSVALLRIHCLQRKHMKRSLDLEESAFDEFTKGYAPDGDDEDVAYESQRNSGTDSLVESLGASRV